MPPRPQHEVVRYAAVGAGWITQDDFLPGIAHTGNSELAALVTGNAEKGRRLAARYGIDRVYGYDDYDAMIASGDIDAIYLALPNSLHRDYAVRALTRGVHVLCEKPMAPTEDDCAAMVEAARQGDAKLMIAYRLHFDEATLAALDVVRSGKLGEPRFFAASFAQQIAGKNHRTLRRFWAGPLPDMGPYPINMARHVFAAEPVEAIAIAVTAGERRFSEVPEMVSVTLRFPGQRLASFTVSFGASPVDEYRIVGTEGDLRVSPGFGLRVPYGHVLTVRGEKTEHQFPPRDQFGGETKYFSECILRDRQPEPDGTEGLADIRVLNAIEMACTTGTLQEIGPALKRPQPTADQVVRLEAVASPELVDAAPPDAG